MIVMVEWFLIVLVEWVCDELVKLVFVFWLCVGFMLFVDIGLVDVFLFELFVLCLELDEYYWYKDVYEYLLIVLE